jgi:hypothetical protein
MKRGRHRFEERKGPLSSNGAVRAGREDRVITAAVHAVIFAENKNGVRDRACARRIRTSMHQKNLREHKHIKVVKMAA